MSDLALHGLEVDFWSVEICLGVQVPVTHDENSDTA